MLLKVLFYTGWKLFRWKANSDYCIVYQVRLHHTITALVGRTHNQQLRTQKDNQCKKTLPALSDCPLVHMCVSLSQRNHAGVSEETGSVSAGCCPLCQDQDPRPDPSTPPFSPWHPHPFQWDRGVGKGLSVRDPPQGGGMVAATHQGTVEEGSADGGKTTSDFFTDLLSHHHLAV